MPLLGNDVLSSGIVSGGREHALAVWPKRAGKTSLSAGRSAAARTVCMAHPRRVAKVAKQIEREVGTLLISDKLLQAAVCPERRRGFDGALSALCSVTEVQISNDLQVAKVYLTIYSDDVGKATAIEGLQRLEGYVRKHIGRQVRLRLTPEIRFLQDDTIERTERIYRLLDQVKAMERGEMEPPPLAFHGVLPGDEDWEVDEDSDDSEDEEEMARQWGGSAGAFQTVDLGMFGDAPAAAVSSSSSKKAAASRPQQRRPAAAAAVKKTGSSSGSKAITVGEGEDEELAAMLQTFRQQVQERRGQSQQQ